MTEQSPPIPVQAPNEPKEAPRRRRRWLLAAIGIPFAMCCALLGCVVLGIYQSGGANISAMGTWPGPEASPEQLISVDLSDLGLTMGQSGDVREEPGAPPRQEYIEGSFIDYQAGDRLVVELEALKYEDSAMARNAFFEAAREGIGTCGTFYIQWGVIHCVFPDAFEKIYWNDVWLVRIIVVEGTEFTLEELSDRFPDARTMHWKEITRPWRGRRGGPPPNRSPQGTATQPPA